MTLTAEQHTERRNSIGSSDAAAAIGLNPYFSSIELWQEKRGTAPPFQGNESTKWGQLLEPAVRQEYAEQTGRVVRLPPDTIVHPDVPFITCHPDGVTDDRRLYEGKCARFPDNWGEHGSDEIPEHYLIQVQHALMVTRLPVCDVAVLIGGADFRIYEVGADLALQGTILEAEREFWVHVQKGTQPKFDASAPGAIAVLKKLYPGTNGKSVKANDACIAARARFEVAKAQEKDGKEAADTAKAQMLEFMGEASILTFPDGKGLRRAEVNRKAYTVGATKYMDARIVKA